MSTVQVAVDNATFHFDKLYTYRLPLQLEGQVFEGSSAENQDYTAGSDELIDDFLTQIIGAMPGGTHLIEILNILENFDMASMEVTCICSPRPSSSLSPTVPSTWPTPTLSPCLWAV